MSATMFRACITCALFSTFPAQAQMPTKVIPPQQKVLSTENGRFTFGQVSDKHEDQYVLDTATGRIWHKVIATVTRDGEAVEVEVFQAVPYEDRDGKWTLVPR